MERTPQQKEKDELGFTLADLRKAIPPQLFIKSELRFLVSVGYSVSFSLLLMYIGKQVIPLTWWMLPVWICYAAITGTVLFGVWILGHECGHGAFSESSLKNDILGFILHTSVLVPYFSWQHSHAVHHSKTSHMTEGESHVPYPYDSPQVKKQIALREFMGQDSFAIFQLIEYMILAFPLYLLMGYSGGPARGFTSHFIVPNKLFPQKLIVKVNLSTVGLLGVFYFLYLWAQQTSFAEVFAVYIGPYLVVNAWLVVITLLHHTDPDVPFYDETSWTWLNGALSTIDRNYPAYIDVLHHYIGTTHVLHHIFSDIPHYNAKEGNIYLKQVLGNKYNYDNKHPMTTLLELTKFVGAENNGKGLWYHK